MKSTNFTQMAIGAYSPSPNDGKFATDLFHALQNNAPLTLLQKTFIVTTALPGPIEWKLAFFDYVSSFSSHGLPPSFTTAFLALVVFYILRKIYWRVKIKPLTFLELTFPHSSDKSAYATEKLFTLFHSLAKQQRVADRLLGCKKQYSLEIVAAKEDGIRYIVAVPVGDYPIVKKNILSYSPGLKVKEITDYPAKDLKEKRHPNGEDKTGIIELKLSNDFALPLEKHKTLGEHDPIAYLTGNMTKLNKDEVIVFQTVITPVTKSGNRSEIKHMGKLRKLIYSNRPLAGHLFSSPLKRMAALPQAILFAIFKAVGFAVRFVMSMIIAFWDTEGKRVPFLNDERQIVIKQEIQNPYEQELQSQIKEKIDKPMFEASLRLFVRSDNKEQYRLRVSGFLASFHSLGSAYQSLVKKSRRPFSFFLRELSFRQRQVSLSNNPILSASELSDIYHFPHSGGAKTEDLVKAKSPPLPAPLSFKKTATQFDNVFAKNSYGGTETLIGQTLEERRRHTYILGATGSGKTNLLSNMIYEDIRSGKGVCVIDPHGDLTDKLLRVIPKDRTGDVVFFAPDDDAFPVALNLLELANAESLTGSQLQKQKSLITSSIISIIQKFYDAKFFGPRMEYVLRNTILTALETPDPTLQTILDLLTKTRYRKEVVKNLQNKVLQDYWVYEFQKLGSLQRNSVISPITNKIGGLLASPINYNILTQTKSKIDFEDVINSGKILLCDLSKGKIGEDESSFFGSLILAKIQLAALGRARLKEENRKDFYLYVDEFQNFATATFSELVSEARKYRLSAIIAHQSISQIENRDIVKVILANVGTVICFKTANPEDEQFILPIFTPEVSKHEIANLPLYNFYMKVSVGQAEDTFLAEADDFTVKGDDKTAEAVIGQSRKRYATEFKKKESKSDKTEEDSTEGSAKKKPKVPKKSQKREKKKEGVLP